VAAREGAKAMHKVNERSRRTTTVYPPRADVDLQAPGPELRIASVRVVTWCCALAGLGVEDDVVEI